MSIARLQSFDSLIAIMVVCEMPVFRMDSCTRWVQLDVFFWDVVITDLRERAMNMAIKSITHDL